MRASSGPSHKDHTARVMSLRRPATNFLGAGDVIGWAIVVTALLALLHEVVQPW